MLSAIIVVVFAVFVAVAFAAEPVTPKKPVTAPKLGDVVYGKNKGEMLMPSKFGNFTTKDLVTALPCGYEMASFNGIPAYSNGDYQGTGDSCGGWSSTGLQFQCVEYAQRYFNYLYGVAPVWPVDYAKQMCYSYPGGVVPVGYPQVGFGVVFNWGYYGHVAVVADVGGSTITVIEQNGSPSGWNTYYQSDVYCYLAPAR
jgi:hypothetical protein